jgi:hypothetical protein
MAIQIQKRRDTSLNWFTVNPLLADGEEGIERDTGFIKIGNGIDRWNSLPYSGDSRFYTKVETDTLLATTSGTIIKDHSELTGLDNDDHIQYILSNGSRQLSSDWNYGSASISGTGNFHGNGATLSNIGYVENGDIYFYDTTRNKDLGVGILQIGCGRNANNTTNQYLRVYDGVPMDMSSISLPFNSTLVGMTMNGSSDTQSWTAQIRSNGSPIILDYLSIVNSRVNCSWDKNTDFSMNDRIQVYLKGVAISYPTVMLFFRRRK